MPHRRYIYAKSYDMAKAKMYAYDHALTHWKFLFQFWSNYPCINITDQETYNQYSDTTPSIRFRIYHIILRCTAHSIIPLKDKKMCRMCKQESSFIHKIYTLEKS